MPCRMDNTTQHKYLVLRAPDSGSLAMLAAMRRASVVVDDFLLDQTRHHGLVD